MYTQLVKLCQGSQDSNHYGLDSLVRYEVHELLKVNYGEDYCKDPFFVSDREMDTALFDATKKFFNRY